jgi:hypothetical protein
VAQVENIHDPNLAPRTVTVSISTHTSGRVRAETYKTTDTDGTCSYKITTNTKLVYVVGTLTQDDATLDANNSSYSFIEDRSVRQMCPH